MEMVCSRQSASRYQKKNYKNNCETPAPHTFHTSWKLLCGSAVFLLTVWTQFSKNCDAQFFNKSQQLKSKRTFNIWRRLDFSYSLLSPNTDWLANYHNPDCLIHHGRVTVRRCFSQCLSLQLGKRKRPQSCETWRRKEDLKNTVCIVIYSTQIKKLPYQLLS